MGQGELRLYGEGERGMEMDREMCERKSLRRANDDTLQYARREVWEKVKRGMKKDNWAF